MASAGSPSGGRARSDRVGGTQSGAQAMETNAFTTLIVPVLFGVVAGGVVGCLVLAALTGLDGLVSSLIPPCDPARGPRVKAIGRAEPSPARTAPRVPCA
jgi:hypothetical protein